MTTGRLGNDELAPGQADPEVTVNEADAYIATLANLAACVGVLTNDPPGGSPPPVEYDTYVVGTGTGAWAGHDDEIAFFYNDNWLFITPKEGMYADDNATGDLYRFDGAAWSVFVVGGGVTFATTTETLTGTSAAKAVTPDSNAALWEAGADITDGATITIGEGGYFNLITSTTAITAFTITTDKTGRTFRCRFNTIRTLTHNGTSLILPTSANITTAAGDIAQFRSLGSGNVVCEWYTRADGKPLTQTAPTESFVIAASDETTALTTGTAKVTFRMPYAFTLTDVRASVTTAPTGGTLLTVDVNETGATILSTKLTFDASEKTTTTATTPRVISDSALADDAEITIDIDAVGSTIAGAGLKVTLIGHQ